MKAGLYAATTTQLEQRRDELLFASGVLEHQLRVVTAALCAREPHGKQLEAGVDHGTRDGYRAGCHCTCCCGANAAFQAGARARANERQRARDRAARTERPAPDPAAVAARRRAQHRASARRGRAVDPAPGGDTMTTTTPTPHEPILRARVPIKKLGDGRVRASCWHCDWTKTGHTAAEIADVVKYHRAQHARGDIEVTK
jgi:hypothetical protein